MMIRKGAVSMAIVAAVTASAASAFADAGTTKLSLDPTVTMDAAAPAPRAPLMAGLEKLGVASTLDQYGINIYGWVEGSYTYNHQHINRLSSVNNTDNKVGPIGFLPFNHEVGDNVQGNQLALRIERQLADTTKMDVGGLVEVIYGMDAAGIHSNGNGYNGDTDVDAQSARFHPGYQIDISQAYLDFTVGVKGLTLRAGKFYTTMGYEVINPNGNALFSHSYIFYSLPFTQTGVLAMYQVNDALKITGGITRGWDQAFEDSPSCYPDALLQVAYTVNSQLGVVVNASTGPENGVDNTHWRTAINPIITYKFSDALSFAAEGLYIYDGNYAGAGYGDVWGVALYASYKINDYFTVNGRAEKYHNYTGAFSSSGIAEGSSTNVYSFTLGVAITPFPTDPLGSGLKIRPEVRYDCAEDGIFPSSEGSSGHRGQFTIGADIYYTF